MTSTITDERLKEIMDGCEGVTPGPWQHYRNELRPGYSVINEVQVKQRGRSTGRTEKSTPIVQWGGFDNGHRPERKHALNAAHIARLDPASVASIVTELLAAREALSAADYYIDRLISVRRGIRVRDLEEAEACYTSCARALSGNRSGN